MKNAIVLDKVANSRYNNLNILRFIAAITVIISHSFPICYGMNREDFVDGLTGGMLNLGGIAVGVFFVTGGYLIARSVDNKKQFRPFFGARVKRIFPSLAVMILFWVFVLGPVLTTLSLKEYFGNSATYKYLLNILLIPIHSLPGVFEINMYPSVVNGALWTLPVEFMCYIGCYCAYKLKFFNCKKFTITLVPVVATTIIFFYMFRDNIVMVRVVRAILLYYIGIGYYVFRDTIKINKTYGLLAILLFIMTIILNMSTMGMLLVFPYMIYFLAYGLPGKLCEFGKKYEISYGMYLWGWPIQQILSGIGDIFSKWYINAITTTTIVILLGLINNIFVEKNIV